jgi:hypothetical protein
MDEPDEVRAVQRSRPSQVIQVLSGRVQGWIRMRLSSRARSRLFPVVFGLVSFVISPGCRFISGYREMKSLSKVGRAEDDAYRVYRRGTSVQATQTLLALAQLLEAEEREWEGTPHGRTLSLDLALTYGRLGALAERNSSESQSKQFLVLAEDWYTRSGSPQRSGKRLRELVALADEDGDRGLGASSESK